MIPPIFSDARRERVLRKIMAVLDVMPTPRAGAYRHAMLSGLDGASELTRQLMARARVRVPAACGAPTLEHLMECMANGPRPPQRGGAGARDGRHHGRGLRAPLEAAAGVHREDDRYGRIGWLPSHGQSRRPRKQPRRQKLMLRRGDRRSGIRTSARVVELCRDLAREVRGLWLELLLVITGFWVEATTALHRFVVDSATALEARRPKLVGLPFLSTIEGVASGPCRVTLRALHRLSGPGFMEAARRADDALRARHDAL